MIKEQSSLSLVWKSIMQTFQFIFWVMHAPNTQDKVLFFNSWHFGSNSIIFNGGWVQDKKRKYNFKLIKFKKQNPVKMKHERLISYLNWGREKKLTKNKKIKIKTSKLQLLSLLGTGDRISVWHDQRLEKQDKKNL